MKKITLALSLILTLAAGIVPAAAQDFDDDLYYSPSKAAKEQKKQAEEIQRRRDEAIRQATQQQTASFYNDYESADKYATNANRPLNIDVDAYNRRDGSSTAAVANTANESTDFNYTRRIER